MSEYILAIEAAIRGGSLAIVRESEVISSLAGNADVARSESLLVDIDRLILDSGLKKEELGLIAVSNGPGSFTGIRVGISTALGLSDGLGIPCVGTPILDAIQFSYPNSAAIILPFGKNEFCWKIASTYDSSESLAAGTPSDLFEAIAEIPSERILIHDYVHETLEADSQLSEILRNASYLGVNMAKFLGIVAPQLESSAEPIYLSRKDIRNAWT